MGGPFSTPVFTPFEQSVYPSPPQLSLLIRARSPVMDKSFQLQLALISAFFFLTAFFHEIEETIFAVNCCWPCLSHSPTTSLVIPQAYRHSIPLCHSRHVSQGIHSIFHLRSVLCLRTVFYFKTTLGLDVE